LYERSQLMAGFANRTITVELVQKDFVEMKSDRFFKLYHNASFIKQRITLDENIRNCIEHLKRWDDEENIISSQDTILTLMESKNFARNMCEPKFYQFLTSFAIDIEKKLQRRFSNISAKEAIRKLLYCDTFCLFNRQKGQKDLFEKRFNEIYSCFEDDPIFETVDQLELTVELCAVDNLVHENRGALQITQRFRDLALFYQQLRFLSNLQNACSEVLKYFQIPSFTRRILNNQYYEYSKSILTEFENNKLQAWKILTNDRLNEAILPKKPPEIFSTNKDDLLKAFLNEKFYIEPDDIAKQLRQKARPNCSECV